jgi:hypothetical protein
MFKIIPKHELEKMEFKELLRYHAHLKLTQEKEIGGEIVQELMDMVMDEVDKRMRRGY